MDEAELNDRLDADAELFKAKRNYEKMDKESEGNEERKAAMEELQALRKNYEGETPEERYKRKTEDRDAKMKK